MVSQKKSCTIISSNLLVYGITHAVVDGICAAVVFSIIKNQMVSPSVFIGVMIIYNALAFGLQAIFGLITDYFQTPRAAALMGCFLTGFSAITFPSYPFLAVVMAGMGNALFHVGGGIISLNLTPNKASAPGIFVAPGALGLLVGTILGKNGQFVVWPAVIGLIILSLLMLAITIPDINFQKETVEEGQARYLESIILLVLLSISIRSLVGSVLVFPWKTNVGLLLVLTGAVVLGKGLGGIVGDKFGWVKTAVIALVVSIPLLVFGSNIPFFAIIGMFLFNITMPITLVAVANVLPGRPGFAFGLTTLALLIGVAPTLFTVKQLLTNSWIVLGIMIISTSALYYGLKKYNKLLSN